MIKDYLSLALNAITKRRLRSYLTMIGVFIGIAAVVALIGLGEGLRVTILGQFGGFGPDVLSIQAGGVQAGPPGTGVINPLQLDDVDKINNIKGVKIAFSRMIRTLRVKTGELQKLSIVGSMVDGEGRKEIERILNVKPEEGRLLKDGDTNKVVLGNNFARTDRNQKPVQVGQRIYIEDKAFEVVGILKKQGSFLVDGIVLLNENTLRSLVDDNKNVDVIAVIVQDYKEIEAVTERIEKKMRQIRGVKLGDEDFAVQSAQNVLNTVNSTLFAVNLFVYIIAGISLLVGSIGITNTMFTAVLERTKEIGIMKSIGAKNSTIFSLFFIESGLMGMVGGIIGIVSGVTLASGMAWIGRFALGSDLISAHYSPWLLLGALTFSFILGSLAGTIPAMNAAKLRPVDALRYTH